MTSAANKTIVIVVATGNRGSSVAPTFLSIPNWYVRLPYRNPSSAASPTLHNLGAEIVQDDLSVHASLNCAFPSPHTTFTNTNFWATYLDFSTPAASTSTAAAKTSGERAFDLDVSRGINVAKAAADVEPMERSVSQALGLMRMASEGKCSHSYHWDSKAKIVQYIETQQLELARKVLVIFHGYYVTNPLLLPMWDNFHASNPRHALQLALANPGKQRERYQGNPKVTDKSFL